MNNPRAFGDRLKRLGHLLKYFPMEERELDDHEEPYRAPLNEEEMCDILDAAKPGHWHHKMLEQDMEYGAHMENIDSYVEFLHRFYRSDAYEEKFNQLKRNENKRKNNEEEGTTTTKRKKRRSAPKEGKGKGSKPLCNICKRHHDGTCWFKE